MSLYEPNPYHEDAIEIKEELEQRIDKEHPVMLYEIASWFGDLDLPMRTENLEAIADVINEQLYDCADNTHNVELTNPSIPLSRLDKITDEAWEKRHDYRKAK